MTDHRYSHDFYDYIDAGSRRSAMAVADLLLPELKIRSLLDVGAGHGAWAAEWVFGDPTDEECDGLSIMWRMHQKGDPARLPPSRTVVHVVLTGPGAAEGWLTLEKSGITVCKDDQGLDVDLAVEADTVQMNRWLVGLVPFRELVRSGHAPPWRTLATRPRLEARSKLARPD
jgi:hypothetical protein